MEENTVQTIETAHQELDFLQAEIDTLRARRSIAECIREELAPDHPIHVIKRKERRKGFGSKEHPQVEVTILESDFIQLKSRAQSTAWIERKLSELKHLGDSLWHQLNQKAILQDALNRAEQAEICCRSLQKEIERLKAPPVQAYDQDDGTDREIDYPWFDNREP